jgi:EAL domain-containing protein (putative c-di-GMP-specific phosphodiesterase class I)
VFIPIAEKVGLIKQLNEWVIREVSIIGAKHYAQDKLKGKISINVSTSQLEESDFIDSLVDIFRFSELPIQSISFDIKDDISLCQQHMISKNIKRLDKMGVDICLDSYGAKYSYFTTMTELPIRRVKIS